MKRGNACLVAGAAALASLPMLLPAPSQDRVVFRATDARAQDAIAEVAPGYRPWFAPLWRPPSAESECLLFGLQSALGAGLLAYCLGYSRGRNSARTSDAPTR